MKRFIALIIFTVLLSSCVSKQKEKTSQESYQEAMKYLKVGNYARAGEMFEKIEDDQPFSDEATNGLIMASYSYYKAKHYEDSIRVIDYFIQSNPINQNISYMYYLKGLNYFDRMKSMSKARDITEAADSTFRELIYKFPDTEYANDAKKKLEKTETFLSGNEMIIANYYFKRKNYIGAINHYTKILQNFPQSDFVPESLYRLIEINAILGLKFESVQYYKILSEQYKDSKWTKYSTNTIKKYEKK